MHSSFLQFGRLHLSIFGISAAMGIMAAIGLSQRTAHFAGLDRDRVWDASVSAVVSTFVLSRLLLIVFNWHSFLQYPLLLLAVPSLTTLGMVLTAAFMLIYLRFRGVPFMAYLDAMAPCVALLWAFLSFGRWLDGTRDGMPMQSGTNVYAVEVYTFVAASIVCIVAMTLLLRTSSMGNVSGVALVLSGIAIFFIDFFRLPSNLFAVSWIDPAQWLALLMICAGCVLFVRGEAAIRIGGQGTQQPETAPHEQTESGSPHAI